MILQRNTKMYVIQSEPGPLPDSLAAVFVTGFLLLSLALDMTKLTDTFCDFGDRV